MTRKTRKLRVFGPYVFFIEALTLRSPGQTVHLRVQLNSLAGAPIAHPGPRGILDEFAAHCLSFVDVARIKPLKIAVDAGNGMAGATAPHVFKHLPCEVVPLYFELDGSFPNHPASPIEPENMADVQAAVKKHRCDLGVAFDGEREIRPQEIQALTRDAESVVSILPSRAR